MVIHAPKATNCAEKGSEKIECIGPDSQIGPGGGIVSATETIGMIGINARWLLAEPGYAKQHFTIFMNEYGARCLRSINAFLRRNGGKPLTAAEFRAYVLEMAKNAKKKTGLH